MERKEILEKIRRINGDILVLDEILKTMEVVAEEGDYPIMYESLAIEAAMKMEKSACDLRHLIYAAVNITKRELMKKVICVHEIEINYTEGIFSVAFPALLPNKSKMLNSEFICDPLHFALDEYFKTNDMEIFVECVVAFEHIYDEAFPSRRICDYDNLELKSVLDTVSAFVMTDDGGKYCDVFHTTGYAGKDCTKISVMTKNKFKEWVKNRENTVSENI